MYGTAFSPQMSTLEKVSHSLLFYIPLYMHMANAYLPVIITYVLTYSVCLQAI